MRRRAFGLAVAAWLVAASAAFAQQKEPLPFAVADLRASSVGLTTGIGWTPAVPSGTQVPGRGLGFDAGAHVYFARFKAGGFGVGGTFLAGRGHIAPIEATTTAANLTPLPGVTTTLTALVPQLSFNFGHRLGWSYVSGGIGRTRVKSEVTDPVAGAAIPAVDSNWTRTLNYGGGARWFINDHLAFNLELRWYKIAAVEGSATQAALPRQSLIVVGAGISLK